MNTTKRPLFVDVAYHCEDKVRFGPHEARVSRLFIASNSVLYELTFWIGDEQKQATAYEWELDLIEAAVDG